VVLEYFNPQQSLINQDIGIRAALNNGWDQKDIYAIVNLLVNCELAYILFCDVFDGNLIIS
jgi:hypothetical protein